MKPEVVDLHPEELQSSGDEENTDISQGDPDKGLKIRRTVTQVKGWRARRCWTLSLWDLNLFNANEKETEAEVGSRLFQATARKTAKQMKKTTKKEEKKKK